MLVSAWNLIRQTFKEWSFDQASRLAAALAYYTAVATAPLLLLFVTTIGWFFGSDSAQVQVVGQLRGMIGPQGADVAQMVIENADRPNLARVAGFLSLATILWAATNVFVQLQNSLNIIWGVEPKEGTEIVSTIRERFLSFGMIVVIGFVLLVSLILSSVLSVLSGTLRGFVPGLEFLWKVVDFVASFGITTLLFALVYKVLPDAEFSWRDVWMGATVTAILFTIGKWLLGLYLGNQSLSSSYGAAGSLVVTLLWLYYSAHIFFFGAEFTQVYARREGKGIVPDEKSQPISSRQPGEAKFG